MWYVGYIKFLFSAFFKTLTPVAASVFYRIHNNSSFQNIIKRLIHPEEVKNFKRINMNQILSH